MNNPGLKKSNWCFPPDIAVLSGFYIVVPAIILDGWLGPGLFASKNTGNSSFF
jgi:hypothetical protein